MGLNKRLIDQAGVAAATGSEYFDIATYTGTGATKTISGFNFQPDIVLTKSRTFFEKWNIFDSSRGVQNRMYLNDTHIEATTSNSLTSFNSDGYTFGDWTDMNTSGEDFVSYSFKESVDAGVSITLYTGNGSTQAVSHSLGVSPDMVIIKSRDTTRGFLVHFSQLGAGSYMFFNSANGESNSTARVNTVTSSVVNIGTSVNVNGSSTDYVMYAFASKSGSSKFGTFTGTGSNTSITGLGFQPRFLMIKRTDTTGNFVVIDSERSDNELYANLSNVESQEPSIPTFDSDGFSLYGARYNNSGGDFVYWAIA